MLHLAPFQTPIVMLDLNLSAKPISYPLSLLQPNSLQKRTTQGARARWWAGGAHRRAGAWRPWRSRSTCLSSACQSAESSNTDPPELPTTWCVRERAHRTLVRYDSPHDSTYLNSIHINFRVKQCPELCSTKN